MNCFCCVTDITCDLRFGKSSGAYRRCGERHNRSVQVEPDAVRILVVGTGGVGSAFASIAQRRSFFEHCALADYDAARASALVADWTTALFGASRSTRRAGGRRRAHSRDAADAVLNAVDPLFNVPIFDACSRPASRISTWR